jgi:hypothetical protein
MAIIKPSDLPPDTTPADSAVLVTETGGVVSKSTIAEVAASGRPFASQAEAETGSGTTQTMNPLATKQAIDYARTQAQEFTAVQTFSTTSAATAVVRAVSTEAGATAGPFVDLVRDSASPAISDYLGMVRFRGDDSAGNETTYAQVRGQIVSSTDGTEGGLFEVAPLISGALTSGFMVYNGVRVGAPTGSFQGTGTINTTGYYLNGSLLNSGLFGITPGSTGLAILQDTSGSAVRTEIGAAAIAANSFTAAQTVTPVPLTDGATITPDLTLSNHFTLTLGGNRALANPSSKTVGTSFLIVVAQDATGSRTLSFGTDYEFPGGTPPTLTTTANGVDLISGYVYSSTRILCNIAKAFA